MSYPPYSITAPVLKGVANIYERLMDLPATDGQKAELLAPRLRKENRIRTIHASLAIENNSLSLEQVTAILEGKRVVAPSRDIKEVKNAIVAYENLGRWHSASLDDLLEAHGMLMGDLVENAGALRITEVGILKGSQVIHVAPPANLVPSHMRKLLDWLKKTDEHPLVASCVFHYEFEFIHPFLDGNGRMGRLWQTLILSEWKSLFAYIPVETVVHDRQQDYYASLGRADSEGEATNFIEFMLDALDQAIIAFKKEQEISRNSSINSNVDEISTNQVDDRNISKNKKLEDNIQVLLNSFAKNEMSANELMTALQLRHSPSFRKNYLLPALENGYVAMTVPDSPRSSKQKYKLTSKGRKHRIP